MISYARTDIGRARKINQDTVFASSEPIGILPNLFIVADGMGGHKAGEVASFMAASHIAYEFEHHNEFNDDACLDISDNDFTKKVSEKFYIENPITAVVPWCKLYKKVCFEKSLYNQAIQDRQTVFLKNI